MLNHMTQQQQEDYLNDFIDSLILECKPQPPTSMDQELFAMLETVRGVKRLREDKALLGSLTDVQETAKPVSIRDQQSAKPAWRKWWFSGAAVAATLFLAVGIFTQINRMSPATDGGEISEMAPAMLRSAEIAEDAETPAEIAPGEAPMMAMETPAAEEDTITMFGLGEAPVNAGVAVVVRQLENSYLELRLIDLPANYQEFRIAQELQEALETDVIQQGALYSVTFEVEEGGMPLLTMLQPLDQAVMEAHYLGRADSNFAEFSINDKVQVMALSEEAKKMAETFDEGRLLEEGVDVRITVIGSSFSTNGMVEAMEKISD